MWYFGKDGFSHKNSGKAGLLFEAKAAGQPLLSDTSWQVRRHPAFGQTGKPAPNFRLPESNVRFDARLDDCPDWFKPQVSLDWPRAVALGKAGVAPWGKLMTRPIPLWRDSGLRVHMKKSSGKR